MQLNNITTGEIIKISKTKDSGIFYLKYENSYCKDNTLYYIEGQTDPRNTNIKPSIPMTEKELVEYTSYLKLLEKEVDFELVTIDDQNWTHTRLKRIICKNNFLTSTMLKDPLFKLLIDNIILYDKTEKIIWSNNFTTIIYINTIGAEDVDIVTPYVLSGDIIVEDKII